MKLKLATLVQCLREDLATLRRYRRVRPSRLDHAVILGNMRRDGFHVIRGYLDPNAATAMARILDTLTDEFPERIEVDAENSDHRLWGSERASPELGLFHADPVLANLGMAYLRTDVTNVTTLGGKLVAQPGGKGSGGGWHRDSMFESQFKAILYLSDVGASNGPFQYLRASHGRLHVCRTLALGDGANPKRFANSKIDDWLKRSGDRVETIMGRPGDVILADTRGLHRGQPIQDGVRYALTNYYFPGHKSAMMREHFAPLVNF